MVIEIADGCDVMVAIEARRTDTLTDAKDTDQVFRNFDAHDGFACYGEDQVRLNKLKIEKKIKKNRFKTLLR